MGARTDPRHLAEESGQGFLPNCSLAGRQETRSGAGPCLTGGRLVMQRNQGEFEMGTGHETAAAILVQTIFLKDGHLQGILGEQASKSATLAAEYLKPFY